MFIAHSELWTVGFNLVLFLLLPIGMCFRSSSGASVVYSAWFLGISLISQLAAHQQIALRTTARQQIAEKPLCLKIRNAVLYGYIMLFPLGFCGYIGVYAVRIKFAQVDFVSLQN